MAVSPFCWVSLNSTGTVSPALGVKASPPQERDLAVFPQGGDHHFCGTHSGLHSLPLSTSCLHVVIDKGEI